MQKCDSRPKKAFMQRPSQLSQIGLHVARGSLFDDWRGEEHFSKSRVVGGNSTWSWGSKGQAATPSPAFARLCTKIG